MELSSVIYLRHEKFGASYDSGGLMTAEFAGLFCNHPDDLFDAGWSKWGISRVLLRFQFASSPTPPRIGMTDQFRKDNLKTATSSALVPCAFDSQAGKKNRPQNRYDFPLPATRASGRPGSD